MEPQEDLPRRDSSSSSLMGLIEESVQRQARMLIQAKFTEPSSRDDVQYFRSQLKKQLVAANSLLNHAVQNKLDAMKQAEEIMEESSVTVSDTFRLMCTIDARIEDTNTAISNFETLKRVHFARTNLKKVISQVEFFAKVPMKVSELKTILEEEPYRLKEVYLESIKLESLRKFILDEINEQHKTLLRKIRQKRKNEKRVLQLKKIQEMKDRGIVIQIAKKEEAFLFLVNFTRTSFDSKWGIIFLHDAVKRIFSIGTFVQSTISTITPHQMKAGDILETINGVDPNDCFADVNQLYAFMKEQYDLNLTIRRPVPAPVEEQKEQKETKSTGWFGFGKTQTKKVEEKDSPVLDPILTEVISDDEAEQSDSDDDIIYCRAKPENTSLEEQGGVFSHFFIEI